MLQARPRIDKSSSRNAAHRCPLRLQNYFNSALPELTRWADVSYWSVIGGEVGNYAFIARFDSIEAYGRTLASLGADPAFAEFQAKRLKAGQSDWVRSNVAIQVDI